MMMKSISFSLAAFALATLPGVEVVLSRADAAERFGLPTTASATS